MKPIENAMLESIYLQAQVIANNGQTVGEKNDKYITLEQLEKILKSFEE